ncbi:hypothetical protein SO694_00153055 [Aureococcus anophagefferens]|uniref:Uncharacterized protein n=1 Tax=Aureococcus anophagefferens TaxID=44056 RepID=A0ABR1FZQ8_AURAN
MADSSSSDSSPDRAPPLHVMADSSDSDSSPDRAPPLHVMADSSDSDSSDRAPPPRATADSSSDGDGAPDAFLAASSSGSSDGDDAPRGAAAEARMDGVDAYGRVAGEAHTAAAEASRAARLSGLESASSLYALQQGALTATRPWDAKPGEPCAPRALAGCDALGAVLAAGGAGASGPTTAAARQLTPSLPSPRCLPPEDVLSKKDLGRGLMHGDPAANRAALVLVLRVLDRFAASGRRCGKSSAAAPAPERPPVKAILEVAKRLLEGEDFDLEPHRRREKPGRRVDYELDYYYAGRGDAARAALAAAAPTAPPSSRSGPSSTAATAPACPSAAGCVEINHWFGTSRPNFEII